MSSLLDWQKLLIGETEWAFAGEVLIRAVAVYLMLMVIMRLMGKRMAGQMSRSEIAVIVTLGAAVGAPLNAPERGLVPALVALIVAVVFQRGINYLSFKHRKVELAVQGDADIMVRDGELILNELKNDVMPRERMFSFMRQNGIMQLGQVRRAYLEADGHFSVFSHDTPKPGLCILPEYEDDLLDKIDGLVACRSCGHVGKHDTRNMPESDCPRCQARDWVQAVA